MYLLNNQCYTTSEKAADAFASHFVLDNGNYISNVSETSGNISFSLSYWDNLNMIQTLNLSQQLPSCDYGEADFSNSPLAFQMTTGDAGQLAVLIFAALLISKGVDLIVKMVKGRN